MKARPQRGTAKTERRAFSARSNFLTIRGGVDLSKLAEAGALDSADETCREYERVVDPNYLDEIRVQAKQFFTKRLSRQARLAEDTIRRFKNGENTIRPHSLRKLTNAIHHLQNKNMKD